MTPYYEADGITIYHGDCMDVMRELDAGSVDAIVTDPPYGLGFMGKAWDTKSDREFEAWCEGWGREALRVAKPGAHLLAFGAPRTSHRLVAGLEDAGWEIRDTVAWMFGSGFPKSLDVSKALDKAAGAERLRVVEPAGRSGSLSGPRINVVDPGPAITDLARQWQGWGTALKPAYEPVVMARKPLGGTVAATVAEHGTGALNIDACRVGESKRVPGGLSHHNRAAAYNGGWGLEAPSIHMGQQPDVGRWPANVVMDEAAAAMLDAAVGEAGAGGRASGPTLTGPRAAGRTFGALAGTSAEAAFYGDSGGPSRFFYTAKASRSEREAGLAHLEPVRRTDGRESDIEKPWLRTSERRNHHPTVKPVALMRWLVRLVTPPGGIVLDPFLGSGSTRIAAQAEGARFIGIEQDGEYLEIAASRLAQLGMPLEVAE